MVLMPFKDPFDTYYHSIIQPAVTAARLDPQRGDSLFRPSPIMADVWRMIQDARVLVADLTEKNANVFYELGLAHAIGKPVVLIADNIGDVPFDLQPLRVILYDKNDPKWGAELKASITASLDETLADTVLAVPSMFRKIVKSQAPSDSRLDVRMDMLERQLAALATRPERLFGTRSIRDPSELDRELQHVRSRSEAVSTVRRAMFGGLPSRLIQMKARRYLPTRELEAVFSEAGLNARVARRRPTSRLS